jgi:hypothetical protein
VQEDRAKAVVQAFVRARVHEFLAKAVDQIPARGGLRSSPHEADTLLEWCVVAAGCSSCS